MAQYRSLPRARGACQADTLAEAFARPPEVRAHTCLHLDDETQAPSALLVLLDALAKA